MDENGFDVVMFPANGDVGKSDLDTNDESAKHALQNGIKYSIGNRAIRHMGVPTTSVTMGTMEGSKMPVNLTFAGKHGQDAQLLKYAYVYEQYTKHRRAPPVTPQLGSNANDIAPWEESSVKSSAPITLTNVTARKSSADKIRISGSVEGAAGGDFGVEAFVDGKAVPKSSLTISGSNWAVEAEYTPFEPEPPLYGGVGEVVGNVNTVVLVRSGNSIVGKWIPVPQKDV